MKLWKSRGSSGAYCGAWSPLAQRGVPQTAISTSTPRFCALRTSSSRSSNRYAGSNGSVASVGLVGAVVHHCTRVRTTVAWLAATRSSSAPRSASNRSLGSSVNPTHIRSAACAPAASQATRNTSRTSGARRLTRTNAADPIGRTRAPRRSARTRAGHRSPSASRPRRRRGTRCPLRHAVPLRLP